MHDPTANPEPHPSQGAPPGVRKDPVPEIAHRYLISEPTARRIYDCLVDTRGTCCQFDIPEFGGMGQWMPGMVQISRMHDHDLKAKIDGLCSELSAIVRGSNSSSPEALLRPMDTGPSASRVDLPAGNSWWPASYGSPSSQGDSNGIRYAFFPRERRLLIQNGARLEAYATADYVITGCYQATIDGRHTLAFSTDKGPLPMEKLRAVEVG